MGMEHREVLLTIIATSILVFGTIYLSAYLGVSVTTVAYLTFTLMMFVLLGYVLPLIPKNQDVKKRLDQLKPVIFVLGVSITLLIYTYKVSTAGVVSQSDLISMFGESLLIAIVIAVFIVALIGATIRSPKKITYSNY